MTEVITITEDAPAWDGSPATGSTWKSQQPPTGSYKSLPTGSTPKPGSMRRTPSESTTSQPDAPPVLHRHPDPRRPHRPRPLGRKRPTGQPISARPREARHQPLLVRQPLPVPTYHRRRSARLATRSHRRTTPPASCLPETHQPQMETASNQPTHTSQK